MVNRFRNNLVVLSIGQLAEGFLVIEVSGKNDSGAPPYPPDEFVCQGYF